MVGIKDIAKLAGVSIGSVDRVIHNRGRCSEETRQKVESAIKVLNYQPNLVARQLKNGQVCRIAVLQPHPSQDQGYWIHSEEAVAAMLKEHRPYGVEIESYHFNRHKPQSFVEACSRAMSENPLGILLPPVLPIESRQFIEANSHVAMVLYDCSLEDVSVLQSIHQDGKMSGRTAAGLFAFKHGQTDYFAAIGFETPHPYIAARLQGFEEELTRLGYRVPDRIMIPDDLDILQLQEYIKSNRIDLEQYQGVYIAKTGGYKYARLLNAQGHHATVVGYDLTPNNVREMEFGTIDFLISQNCRRQVELGIHAIVDYYRTQKPPKECVVSIPVDIISRCNLVGHQ